jgi:hypothetical protein
MAGVAKLNMRYPNGSKFNAESLLVDPRNHDLYVVTKDPSGVANVFVYPGSAQSPSVTYTLRFVSRLYLPGSATAGDFSPGGREIIIKGYGWTRLWQRPTGMSTRDALRSPACLLPSSGGEAVTYRRDSGGFYTISEGTSPILYWYARL